MKKKMSDWVVIGFLKFAPSTSNKVTLKTTGTTQKVRICTKEELNFSCCGLAPIMQTKV